MAAVTHNPTGFSYAQAARGQSATATTTASQTSSSKVTSGTTSPAASSWSDVTAPRSNWAEDVEASVASKTVDVQKRSQEGQQSIQPKESPANETSVDQIKSVTKTPNGVSGVSSPDLAASSSTATKDEYELLSPPNESSSESAWEVVSQASEPAWIAERRQHQSAAHTEKPANEERKKGKDSTPQAGPKPVVLQEARPPPVNPWAKRAEEAKAKVVSLPSKAPVTSPSADMAGTVETQRPRADSRRKANSVAGVAPDSIPSVLADARKADGTQNRRTNDGRPKSSHQDSEQGPNRSHIDAVSSTSIGKVTPTERQSLPNLTAAQSVVGDQNSWPTPDTVQEKERKDSGEKESEVKRDDEATPVTKRKKQEWKVLPVTPTIKFETIMNEPKSRPRTTPNGERGGRGGSSTRGRGGYRSTQNGASAAERQGSRTGSSPTDRGIETMTDSHARPNTASSENASTRPPGRPSSAGSLGERKQGSVNGHDFGGWKMTDPTALDAKSAQPSNNALDLSENKAAFPSGSSATLRTEPPHKLQIKERDVNSDEALPKPIPRRTSSGTQTEHTTEGIANGAYDVSLPKNSPFVSRKDSRGLDNGRDTTSTTPRGAGKRGGRGRGAARELANGHLGHHAYSNYPQEFFAASPYGFTQSSPYQLQRGQHQQSYLTPRGGWNSRGNPRSQSIPVDSNYYPRVGGYGGPPQQLQSIQTYIPGMFHPNGVPMTAMPYPNQMDEQYVIQMVATQLDYYFSVDNLLKDMFLRKHMDSQGFVFLDVVANFNRVRQLTQEREIIKTACMDSDVIEIRVGDDGKERLRKLDGWEQFLLPVEQREESAQNHGPEHSQRPEKPERPQVQIPNFHPQYRGPSSAGMPSMQQSRNERRSYDFGYPYTNGASSQYGAFNGIPEVMYGDMNGEETRGRAAKSPIYETPVSPLGQPMSPAIEENDNQPDSFPDDQIDALTVVVKMTSQQRLPYHALSSRTFSNGSIDTHSIVAEMDKAADSTPQPKKEGPAIVNGSDMKLPPIPMRRPSPAKQRSSERISSANSDLDVFWVKDQEAPATGLPTDLTTEPYTQLHEKALDQRNHAATGTCPYDMDVLYQFWCHFLIRNFNNRMYTEFATLANEDARQRHNSTGMLNLIKFYDKSLRGGHEVRDRVAKDFVRLVKTEPIKLQGTVYKTFRSAWRDGNLPLRNRKKVIPLLDDKMKKQMEGLGA